jgi:hypothetical protein
MHVFILSTCTNFCLILDVAPNDVAARPSMNLEESTHDDRWFQQLPKCCVQFHIR